MLAEAESHPAANATAVTSGVSDPWQQDIEQSITSPCHAHNPFRTQPAFLVMMLRDGQESRCNKPLHALTMQLRQGSVQSHSRNKQMHAAAIFFRSLLEAFSPVVSQT